MSLQTYLADLPNKGEVEKFALEYYGIEVDPDKLTRAKMEEFIVAEAADLEQLKPLPWEPVTDDGAGDEPDGIDDAPEATPAPEQTDDDETPDLPKQVPDIFEDVLDMTPSFQLSFKRDGELYSVVSFVVTDRLDQYLHGKTPEHDIPSSDPSHQKAFKTALHYIAKYGKVLLRETRNSEFKLYRLEDFS